MAYMPEKEVTRERMGFWLKLEFVLILSCFSRPRGFQTRSYDKKNIEKYRKIH